MRNLENRKLSPPRSMDAGQSAESITAYAAHLSKLGYTALTIQGCVASARHLSAWLPIHSIAVSALDEHVLVRLTRHRCQCGGSRKSNRLSDKYVNRSRRFMRFLGTLGPAAVAVPPPSVVDPRVARFGEWLRHHRGLSKRTIGAPSLHGLAAPASLGR